MKMPMKLNVVCNFSKRVHSVRSCRLVSKLPYSIVICMKVRSEYRNNHTLKVVVKRKTGVVIVQSAEDFRAPPKYSHSIEWKIHKVQYTLLLNDLSIVSKLLDLISRCNFSVTHVLHGCLDERYVYSIVHVQS